VSSIKAVIVHAEFPCPRCAQPTVQIAAAQLGPDGTLHSAERIGSIGAVLPAQREADWICPACRKADVLRENKAYRQQLAEERKRAAWVKKATNAAKGWGSLGKVVRGDGGQHDA
jgi:predicted RNA-binding Zn-ribbon protein involved in translation (DUF1610 family)